MDVGFGWLCAALLSRTLRPTHELLRRRFGGRSSDTVGRVSGSVVEDVLLQLRSVRSAHGEETRHGVLRSLELQVAHPFSADVPAPGA